MDRPIDHCENCSQHFLLLLLSKLCSTTVLNHSAFYRMVRYLWLIGLLSTRTTTQSNKANLVVPPSILLRTGINQRRRRYLSTSLYSLTVALLLALVDLPDHILQSTTNSSISTVKRSIHLLVSAQPVPTRLVQ